VRLKIARQVAIKWSEADPDRAIKQMEPEIHQMTSVKLNLFDKLFKHHQRQLLQEVGTKATGPRSTFAKTVTQMKTAA